MSDGIVYRHTIEALLDQVVNRRQLMTPAELRTRGFEHARACSQAEYNQFVAEVATRLAPGVPIDDAIEQLAREVLRAYSSGLVGKTIVMVARIVGVKSALLRAPAGLNSGDSFTKAVATERGATHVEIAIKKTPGTSVRAYQGILSEFVALLGVKQHTMTRNDTATDWVFDIKWEP